MAKYPTAQNPITFIIREKPPALKNNRQLIYTKSGQARLIKNNKVQKFLKKYLSMIEAVYNEAGFQLLPKHMGLIVICKMVVYQSSKTVGTTFPQSDTDNMTTTLIEMLQNIVVPDDKQITAIWQEREITLNKENQFATLTAFIDDGSPRFVQVATALNHINKDLFKEQRESIEINVPEELYIEDLEPLEI